MTRSELTWLCRRYTRVYQLSVVWRGVAWRRVVAVVTEARPERTKSRASRRVRDCVHACIRPFVCSGFDEAAFTPAPKRHEPINPHLLSVSPTLRALLYPRASTSPEFRWSSPGNRFISPAFLSLRPTVAFQFVPSLFHRFHGDVARLTFWSPVCFYLEDVSRAEAILFRLHPEYGLSQWLHVRLPSIRIVARSVIGECPTATPSLFFSFSLFLLDQPGIRLRRSNENHSLGLRVRFHRNILFSSTVFNLVT